jgi:hypothetical protein
LIYYNWLADSATTLHVTHQREAFIAYTLMENGSVTVMGGKEVKIEGWGAVKLILTCNGHNHILCLEDILHVPRT